VLGTPAPQRVKLADAANAIVASNRATWALEIASRAPRVKRGARAARSAPGKVVAPTLDEITAGSMRLEVLFYCEFDLPDRKKTGGLFWCAGVVLSASTADTRIKGKKLGLGYVFIRYDKAADATEDEAFEEDWFLLRACAFGSRKRTAGAWRVATAMSEPLGLDDLDELDDVEDEESECGDSDDDGDGSEPDDDADMEEDERAPPRRLPKRTSHLHGVFTTPTSYNYTTRTPPDKFFFSPASRIGKNGIPRS
jgi:hypothetical protein